MTRISIDEAAPIMARALLPLVDVHRNAPPLIQQNIASGMSLMIRNLERCVQHRVSVKADLKAREMGLPDLHAFEWRDQRIKMKDKDRKIFHWEHVERVVDIRNEILCVNIIDVDQIEALLKKTFLAWILKCEDRNLPSGLRKDPLGVYKAAGIEFVPLPTYNAP